MCVGFYSVFQYVTVQLQFLQFILQEGVLYLPSKCAKTIWATLVANPDACDWDRDVSNEMVKEWFRCLVFALFALCLSIVQHVQTATSIYAPLALVSKVK